MKITLSPLPYEVSALEPFIDATTMQIHHDKHHQVYVDKLNIVLEKHPELDAHNLEQIMRTINELLLPEQDKMALINHGGGHLNHTFFWSIMGAKKMIDEELHESIKKTFGTIEKFKEEFTQVALNRFGSGWAWLVQDQQNNLKVYSTPNQDSPLLQGHTPLIGLDVWEHAYYLKYQNRRAEYIEKWWNVLKLI